MSVNPKIITSAMQLYFTGESLRNVQKFIRLQGVKVSHQTVYNWINKYTDLMKLHLDKIFPQVGDTWRADEVYVKVKGDNISYAIILYRRIAKKRSEILKVTRNECISSNCLQLD